MKIDCCKTITLKANPNGPIATHQGGVLGDYVKVTPIPPKKQTKQSNKETNKQPNKQTNRTGAMAWYCMGSFCFNFLGTGQTQCTHSLNRVVTIMIMIIAGRGCEWPHRLQRTNGHKLILQASPFEFGGFHTF